MWKLISFSILIFFVNSTFSTKSEETCDKDSCKKGTIFDSISRKINQCFYFSGLKWHEFGWEKYINKDITTVDSEDPYKRFAINIVNSVKIGVNRTIPDHR